MTSAERDPELAGRDLAGRRVDGLPGENPDGRPHDHGWRRHGTRRTKMIKVGHAKMENRSHELSMAAMAVVVSIAVRDAEYSVQEGRQR